MPFFSVIIPTYNRSAQLMTAIHSVLSQDFYDFEVIVVDDGSTDDTEVKIQNIQDGRIRYFRKENEERNIARNYGIEEATGEYINFLDSDDVFYSYHFSTAYSFLEQKNHPEIIHLSYEQRNERDEVTRQRVFRSNCPDQLVNGNPLHGNAIFIRNRILQEFKFLPSKNALVGEDHYLWLRLSSRYKFLFCDRITSVVKEHSQRSLQDIDIDKLAVGTEEIVNSLLSDRAFQNKYKAHIPSLLSFKYGLVAMTFASNGKKKDAVHYLSKALKAHPSSVVSPRILATFKHLIFS